MRIPAPLMRTISMGQEGLQWSGRTSSARGTAGNTFTAGLRRNRIFARFQHNFLTSSPSEGARASCGVCMFRLVTVVAACRISCSALFLGFAGVERVAAFSFEQAIQQCRQTVGRPTKLSCMSRQRTGTATAKGREHIDGCRAQAVPRVRACVRRAMISAFGWRRVEQTIERCRQTVGRPRVDACMRGGNQKGWVVRDLEVCRAKAFPHVRACVRRVLTSDVGRKDGMRQEAQTALRTSF
jgi:hypothetical protein